MKRFHVHVAVDDLAANIRFYSTVFGMPPTVRKTDYAKWMVEDPRINFAISSRGAKAGLDHLGLQVDSDAELETLRAQVAAAEIAALGQPQATCCYARSDKYWISDPQGIAWETYHTLAEAQVFSADTAPAVGAAAAKPEEVTACCAPRPEPIAVAVAVPTSRKSSCC
jgi:catechol 2,3-dioxygenase-like lactoylglutathione lyase family enzyme